MRGMSENVFINIKNRSYTVTAEVETAGANTNGVILAQAGRFGGWSLYVKDGKPIYTYNFLGLKEYTVASTQALPAGKATIRFEFVYDGGGGGKGGTGTIFVNGQQVATGKIDATQANVFSADEGADVGSDEGTAVASAYSIPFKFTGKIHKVTVDLKPMTTADAEAAEKARRQVALKMEMSN
jgi:arylsulfatase